MNKLAKINWTLLILTLVLVSLSLRKVLAPRPEMHLQFLKIENPALLPSPTESEEMMVVVRSKAKPNPNPLQNLADDTLNTNLKAKHRSSQLFKLTQAGEEAAEELAQVAREPVAKDNTQRDFELSLRIRAVEALDGVALKNKIKAQEQLLWVMGGSPDPAVSLLVRASLQGIEQGRPGKVKRVVDQMLKEGRQL